MKKKLAVISGSILLTVALGATAFASVAPKIQLNGSNIGSTVTAKIEKGTVWVSASKFAEALGAKTTWDSKTQTLNVTADNSSEESKYIVGLLQYALVAKTPEEAVNTWVKEVKDRNGAAQYAVLTDALRAKVEKQMKAYNWVTGGSSPWLDTYKVSEGVKNSETSVTFQVEANYTNSAKDRNSTKHWTVKVTKAENGFWYVADTNGYSNQDIFQ
jgi:hypothetical protein